MLPNNVKMVVWDLDSTFWQGTLAEDVTITLDERNIEIVRTLAQRGIVSSICSKNNYDAVKTILSDHGIWDHFVFSKIAFTPKGQNLAEIIEQANLRPENVLFIDDNVLNREEAKHYAPGVMVAAPEEILPDILKLPQLAGKDDHKLTRLEQYRKLEAKSIERSNSNLGNEEFLRQCKIQINIDYNIDDHFDRIVELANRTNQLNYTKTRLDTPAAIVEFRRRCGKYGIAAAVVSVSDKYGNYGIVGYFVLSRTPTENKLLHFVFSCRTMNMGVEQYIYELLQEPTITIVPPVSNPIQCFERVDWITEGTSVAHSHARINSDKPLLLLGACQLLQLSSFCSSRRSEFTNEIRNGLQMAFDDAGFIFGDREIIRQDPALKIIDCWNYEDVMRFDAAVSAAEIILVAPLGIAAWNYFVSERGTLLRIPMATVQHHMKNQMGKFFNNWRYVKMTYWERLLLVSKSLDHIKKRSPATSRLFVLGANPRAVPAQILAAKPNGPKLPARMAVARPGDIENRRQFNNYVKEYCRLKDFCFLDLESIVDESDQFDWDHYTRKGYMAIASIISERLADPVESLNSEAKTPVRLSA
jgi:FkbH-like protein